MPMEVIMIMSFPSASHMTEYMATGKSYNVQGTQLVKEARRGRQRGKVLDRSSSLLRNERNTPPPSQVILPSQLVMEAQMEVLARVAAIKFRQERRQACKRHFSGRRSREFMFGADMYETIPSTASESLQVKLS